ncbi:MULTISPECIES: hypothetical protein [Salipaludibacillus]|nr:hypothetical protein [Salipaludibacillus neizhouensis]
MSKKEVERTQSKGKQHEKEPEERPTKGQIDKKLRGPDRPST